MKRIGVWALACALTPLIVGGIAQAAPIQLTGTYTQNFNSLASAPENTDLAWADDTTIAGWYSTRTLYRANAGSAITGALYSFGTTGDGDRALGSIPTDSTGTVRYGAQFENKTGTNIKELTVSYTAEQWRDGNQGAQQVLDFFLGTTATSLSSAGYTFVPQLRYFSQQNAGAGALDGNADPNRQTISYTITGLDIAKDASFWIRWQDPNSSGQDHGLSIDDFTIKASPTPEPSTLLLGSFGALGGLAAWWRRRKPRSAA
jgi:hypothetical protein